jgi:hypothetical protein
MVSNFDRKERRLYLGQHGGLTRVGKQMTMEAKEGPAEASATIQQQVTD